MEKKWVTIVFLFLWHWVPEKWVTTLLCVVYGIRFKSIFIKILQQSVTCFNKNLTFNFWE